MKAYYLKILIVVFCFCSYNSFAQTEKINSNLELMVEMEQMDMITSTPTALDPLRLNAKVVWSEDKAQLAVVIKANLLQNWQIYAFASDKSAYITTELKFESPNGLSPLGEWQKPKAKYYSDDVTIYKGEVIFTRYYKVSKVFNSDKPIKCGLYYQACDPNQCFPPKTKMLDLKF